MPTLRASATPFDLVFFALETGTLPFSDNTQDDDDRSDDDDEPRPDDGSGAPGGTAAFAVWSLPRAAFQRAIDIHAAMPPRFLLFCCWKHFLA